MLPVRLRTIYLRAMKPTTLAAIVALALSADASAQVATSTTAQAATITAVEQHARGEVEAGARMDVRGAVEIYRGQGLSDPELAKIYRDAWKRAQSERQPSIPERIEPLGWVVAALLLLWLAFKDAISKWLGA